MENISSIFLYYFVFFMAFCFFLAADSAGTDRKAAFYTFLGVMILCFFAGARDLSVGADTINTVTNRFIKINGTMSLEDIPVMKEPIYSYLSFFLHKISDDSWIFLFTIQLLITGPVAISLYKCRKKTFISIGMLVYMLMFFQLSFNIMRQLIAATFLLLAFTLCQQKAYVKSLILSIMSICFHSSAVIGIAFYVGISVFASIKRLKTRIIIIFPTILVLFLLFLNWKYVFSWAIQNDILTERYSTYVSMFSNNTGLAWRYLNASGRTILDIFLRWIGALIVIFLLKFENKKSDFETLFMKCAVLLSAIIQLIMYISFQTILAHRITLYLDVMQILAFSSAYTTMSNCTVPYRNYSIRVKSLNSLIFVFYPLAYNLIIDMICFPGGTLPYKFS